MRIDVIMPDPSVEPRTTPLEGRALLLPSILAGSLDQAGPNGGVVVSDLRQRAQGLADYTGNPVLGLQRLTAEEIAERRGPYGLIRPYSLTEYEDAVISGYIAEIEKVLDSHSFSSLGVLAVSAGGPVGLRIAASAELPVAELHVFDTTAMRHQTGPGALARYGTHMLRHEVGRPSYMRNGHPLPYAVQSETGAVSDMLVHRKVWLSDVAHRDADHLARHGGPAVRMFFAERSFTVGSPDRIREVVESLNLAALSGSGSDFKAEVAPVQHTITDDYEALIRVLDGSITKGYISNKIK